MVKTVKCDCKVSTKDRKPVKAKVEDQPNVYLQRGLDRRYWVGTCSKCKRVHSVFDPAACANE